MPTLPSGFPISSSSYSAGDPGGVLRDDVYGSVASYALEFDRGPQQYTITLLLDALQHSVWCLFYHHIIAKGSISFYMPLDSGSGMVTHLVTMVPGSYSSTLQGAGMTAVSFVVYAENKVYV